MTGEKLFYKYQSLEEKMDKNGKKRNYTIENLANNQLYFNSPTKFNDPFDSRVYCFYLGTEEDFIDLIIGIRRCDRNQARKKIQSNLYKGS